MKNIWQYVSNLGIYDNNRMFDYRLNILTNQIHFISFLLFFFIAIFLTVMRQIENTSIGIGSIRVYSMMFVHIVALFFAKNGFHRFSKYLLVFLSPLIILVIPTYVGFVENESITYYSYAIITFSLIPQLICDLKKELIFYWSAVLYYLFLLIIIEPLMFYYSPVQFEIFRVIDEFYIYHRVPQFVIFVFVNLSVFYLRQINSRYEGDLQQSKIHLTTKSNQLAKLNSILDKQNTELKKVNEEIKNMQLHLVQSDKMASLGTLVAGVAHEINNPLNAIYGGLQIMKEISKDGLKGNDKISIELKEDCNNAIFMMENGFERTHNIVNSLLTFSHKGVSKKKSEDIHHIIDSTMLFLNQKKPNDVVLIKDYKLNVPVPVYPDKMHQVFLNLIDNGYYALSNQLDVDEKLLRISTDFYQGDKKCIITIGNSGANIPDDILDRIFDPFFTTKEPGQGTGLGLAISYKIIDEHKGLLKVENTSDGVEFKIILPLLDVESN